MPIRCLFEYMFPNNGFHSLLCKIVVGSADLIDKLPPKVAILITQINVLDKISAAATKSAVGFGSAGVA